MMGIAGWFAGDRSCPQFWVLFASTPIDRRMLVISFASFWMVSVLVSFVCGCLQFKSLSVCFNLIIVCWFSFHRFTRNPFEVFSPLINPLLFSLLESGSRGVSHRCHLHWQTRCSIVNVDRSLGWYHSAISAPGSQRGPGCPWSGTRRSLLKYSPKHRSRHAASVFLLSNVSILTLELCLGLIYLMSMFVSVAGWRA